MLHRLPMRGTSIRSLRSVVSQTVGVPLGITQRLTEDQRVNRWFLRRGLPLMLVDDDRKPSWWRRSPPVILFTLTRWLVRELIGTLAATTTAIARTLPLLLGVVTFFFFTAEVWQSVGRARGLSYALILLTFIGLGAIFLASRRQLNIDQLARFDGEQSVAVALAESMSPSLLK